MALFKYGSLTIGEKITLDNWRKLVVAASIKQDPNSVDTQAAFDIDDKNFIYVRARAVSSGEYYGANGNGDFFPEQELKDNYKTFIRRGVYVDHKSDSVENAVGIILDAKYWDDPDTKYVECLMAIDASHPIANKIANGIVNSVSMGAIVDRCECNQCHKVATSENEYCEHLRSYMGREYNGKKVYAINRGVNFYELSCVGTPADKDAHILEKVAELAVEKAVIKLAAKFEKLADDYQAKVADKTTKCVKCDKSFPVSEMVKNDHGAGYVCKEDAKEWNKEAAPIPEIKPKPEIDEKLNVAPKDEKVKEKDKPLDLDQLADKIITDETKKELQKGIVDKVREQLKKIQPKKILDRELSDEEILSAVRNELVKDIKPDITMASVLHKAVNEAIQAQDESKKPIDIGEGYSVVETVKVAGVTVMQLLDRGKAVGLYATQHEDGLDKEAIRKYYCSKFSINANTTKTEPELDSKNQTEDITMQGRLSITYVPGETLEKCMFIARKGNLELKQVASNLLNDATQKAILEKEAAGKVQMGVGDYDSTKGKVDHKIEEGKEKSSPAELTKNLGGVDTKIVPNNYDSTKGKVDQTNVEGKEPIQPSAVVSKYAMLLGGKIVKSSEDKATGSFEVIVEGASIARLAGLWKTRATIITASVAKKAKITGTGPEGWAKETTEPMQQDTKDYTDQLARETPDPVPGAGPQGNRGSEVSRYFGGYDKGSMSGGNGDGWARKVAGLESKLKVAATKTIQLETENKVLKATLEKTKKRAEDEKKGQLIGAIMQRMAETGALNPTPEAVIELKEKGLEHEDAVVKATADAADLEKSKLASLDIAALERMAEMINRFSMNTRKAELEHQNSLDLPVITRSEESSSEMLEDKLSTGW